MTFEDILTQVRELPVYQRKQLINEIVDSLVEKPVIKERIAGLHAGSTLYISDDFDNHLPDSFWLGDS
ncbi:MAG: hypothetical protein Phog2KO_41320 [Phototrophicaceae bacterium]